MKKMLSVISFSLWALFANAQSDSLAPSPFSISAGSTVGAGFMVGKVEALPARYDLLHNEFRAYCDSRNHVTLLFDEKCGVRIVAGQLGRRGFGEGIVDYLNSAYPGYKFLNEYSYLRSGYVYRYISPQLVYRKGSEPFNLTLCAGGGLGLTNHAYGIAILQDIGTNDFMQIDYAAAQTRNVNIALDAELAYMRQLSQHWFMNVGFSLSYTGVIQDYDFTYTEQKYQRALWLQYNNNVEGIVHHVAAGIFVNFQWNTKESARAIYE